jgi:hypothetical protein
MSKTTQNANLIKAKNLNFLKKISAFYLSKKNISFLTIPNTTLFAFF